MMTMAHIAASHMKHNRMKRSNCIG
jgi:hypothetical protein